MGTHSYSHSTVTTQIKRARERIAHFSQWKNESRYARKAAAWKRRLKKLVKQAAEQGIKVPSPPPTPEEAERALLQEAQDRVRFSWQVCVGKDYWSPWGTTGWSAVVLTKLNRVWCEATRVDPRTQKVVTRSARVRRDLLVRRDPTKKGKDRPPAGPEEILPPKEEEAIDSPPLVSRVQDEEKRVPRSRVSELVALLADKSTVDDW